MCGNILLLSMNSVYLDGFEVYYTCAGFRRQLEFDEKISLTESSSASKKRGLKLPTQAGQASHVGESGKGKTVVTDFEETAVLSRKQPSKYSRSCRSS